MLSLHVLKCHPSLPLANICSEKVFVVPPFKKKNKRTIIYLFYTVGALLMQYIHCCLDQGKSNNMKLDH